jgi:iron-sulfur cluster repair protein YtfE (RIC family)
MRDFDKVFKYNIEELINYIISEFHSPLREDLVILEQSLKDFMNIP